MENHNKVEEERIKKLQKLQLHYEAKKEMKCINRKRKS